jgi:hypothetical protein
MLTELQVRAAKPAEKLQKLADEKGLYLAVLPSGVKSWRLKYFFAGKEKLLTLGQWPEVSLKEARRRRDEARALVSAGVDPAAKRQEQKRQAELASELAFETVAREWKSRHLSRRSPAYAERVWSQLERFVFPVIGQRSVPRSQHPMCCPSCAVWRHSTSSIQRIASSRPSAWSCVTRLRPAGRTLTRRLPCGARCCRWKPATWPPLPSRKRSAKYCAPSTHSKAHLKWRLPCAWHRCCSCGR